MPVYDFYCVASAKSSKEHLVKLLKKVTATLQPRGGVIRKVEDFGLKPLAYRIRAHAHHHDVGRYFRFMILANPKSLPEVLHRLKVDEEILRVLPTKLTEREALEEKNPGKWMTPTVLPEAHYDALRRTTNIDYYIARTLLETGEITPEEVAALGRHTPKIEPVQRLAEVHYTMEGDRDPAMAALAQTRIYPRPEQEVEAAKEVLRAAVMGSETVVDDTAEKRAYNSAAAVATAAVAAAAGKPTLSPAAAQLAHEARLKFAQLLQSVDMSTAAGQAAAELVLLSPPEARDDVIAMVAKSGADADPAVFEKLRAQVLAGVRASLAAAEEAAERKHLRAAAQRSLELDANPADVGFEPAELRDRLRDEAKQRVLMYRIERGLLDEAAVLDRPRRVTQIEREIEEMSDLSSEATATSSAGEEGEGAFGIRQRQQHKRDFAAAEGEAEEEGQWADEASGRDAKAAGSGKVRL